jgi:hypothetical protein
MLLIKIPMGLICFVAVMVCCPPCWFLRDAGCFTGRISRIDHQQWRVDSFAKAYFFPARAVSAPLILNTLNLLSDLWMVAERAARIESRDAYLPRLDMYKQSAQFPLSMSGKAR